MKLVQAWSGKWHLFQREHKIVAAKPVDKYNRVAKPERIQVLTTCGEYVMIKNEHDGPVEVAFSLSGYPRQLKFAANVCRKCWPVIVDLYFQQEEERLDH